MSEAKTNFDNLIYRLNKTRNKETIILTFSGLFKLCAAAVALIFTISVIEIFARGDESFRTFLALFFLGGTAFFFAVYLLQPVLRAFGIKNLPDDINISLRIGSYYPEIKDNLCNAIQLVRNIALPSGTSKDLSYAAFGNVSALVSDKDFDVIIDKQDFKKSLFAFFMVMVIMSGAFGISQTGLSSAFYRIANYNKSFLPPAPFSLSIEPKSEISLRGKPITIIVRAKGTSPEKVTLFIREEQQEAYDAVTLRSDSAGVYKYEIPASKNNLFFYAEAPWLSSVVRTEEGIIKVVDKPMVRTLSGRLSFPGYTKLSARNFDEQSADLTALRGSQVSLQILSNKSLSYAEIVFEIPKSNNADSSGSVVDTQKVSMKVDDKKAYGSFRISRSCTYYVQLKDVNGEFSANPVKYSIIATNDDYPAISLLIPTTDVQLSEDALLPLKVSISDDYGFSGLKLFYKLIKSNYADAETKYKSISIPLLTSETAAEVPYMWNLNSIGIAPEDTYEYYIEVYDNDIVSGPKTARTQTMMLRLPSLDEVLNNADEDQKKIEKDLKNILNQTEEIKKDVENLNQELLKKPNQKELDWKEKKKMQDLQKKQQEIQEKLNNVQQKLDDVTQSLQENKALSPETLQKYLELQKLMKEVNSPELREMQNKIQKALEQVSPDQIQKAMQQMQFDEENFKKSIERTMKILKRLKAEQKVDALTKRAEELLKKQEELQKKSENANPNDKSKRDEVADQQKKLKDDLKDMSDEMKELENLMKDIGKEMPMDELEKAKDELNEKETSEEMQDAMNEAQNGNFDKAAKSQKSVSKKMKNFAQQMKKLKKEMQNKLTKEVMKKLQKSISDMLELSQKQKALKSKTATTDYNSVQLPNYAKEQADMLDALINVANNLSAIAEKTFAITPDMGKMIGDAMSKMQESVNNLSELNAQGSAQNQGQAMGSMNAAIMKMQSMLSQMQKSGSCDNPGGQGEGQASGSGNKSMSFGERMQQIAAQQQMVNQSLQNMGGGDGGKMNQEEQAKMARIAAEQGKAQKSLEELAKEQKQMGGKKQGLGNLEKIAEEMKQTISDLRNNNINPETMKRQDRILSRLLDATKSINDRDFEKTRESQVGKDYSRQSPRQLDLRTQEGKARAMQDLMKSIQQGYTKDYENLIKLYFEALQKTENPVLR